MALSAGGSSGGDLSVVLSAGPQAISSPTVAAVALPGASAGVLAPAPVLGGAGVGLLDSAAWGFTNGAEFPGSSGSLVRMNDATRGTVAQINYDLGCGVRQVEPVNGRACGRYVALNLDLKTPVALASGGVPTFQMDVLRSASAANMALRVIDGTGQVLQFRLAPPPAGSGQGPTWQSLQVDVSASSVHWGGSNDGKLHLPIKALSIMVAAMPELWPATGAQVANVALVSLNAAKTDPLLSDADLRRPLGDTIGAVVMFSQGQPLSHLPALADLGVRWVRDSFGWSPMEPRPGVFTDWPAEIRQRLWYYRQQQIGVMALLCCDNRSAYPPTTDQPLMNLDPVAFGRYAVEVAKRLKAEGVPFVLEVYNEPHNNLKQLGGQWNGRPSSPWLDHYVKLVREVVRQVKAYDPSIKVLSDDDMWVVHYWFLEAGLPPQLDGFAFHPYSPSPERTAISFDTDWMYPFVGVDQDGSFQSAVRRLREAGNRKLGHVPEMWATEWGWPLGSGSLHGTVTEDLQAAYLARSYVVAHAAGVRATFWFSMIDWNDGPFGLLANNGAQRLSYKAMKTLSQQLGPYSLARQVLGGGHLTSGVQAYLYRSPSGSDHKLVIWNLDKVGASLPLQGALAGARVIDAYGNVVSARQALSGRMEIPLGQGPLYITGVSNDAALDTALASLR